MSGGDFLQVLLGGLSGGFQDMADRAAEQRRMDQAMKMASMNKKSPLDAILGNVISSTMAAGIKKGRTFDLSGFGQDMAGEPPGGVGPVNPNAQSASGANPELWKLLQMVAGGGGGRGVGGKTKRKISNTQSPAASSAGSSFGAKVSQTPPAASPWER